MNKKPVLVDLEKLRALIAGLDLGDQKWNEYVDARWLNYIEWWDSRANNPKRKYQALRSAVVTAGATDPPPSSVFGSCGYWASTVDFRCRINCGQPRRRHMRGYRQPLQLRRYLARETSGRPS